MSNNISRFLAFCLALTITGSSCDFGKNSFSHPYSIVFCDFTSSVDSSSFANIKRNALQILANQNQFSRVEFYSIGKDPTAGSLYTSLPPSDEVRPSEIRKFNNALNKRKDTLERRLDQASSKVFTNRKEPNSCIVDYIEMAFNEFKHYPESRTAKLELYILSDMLECCNTKYCIEKKEAEADYLNIVPQVTDSNVSFAAYPNIHIYIILASNQSHKNNKNKFQGFWTAVFKRYGLPELPYWSTNLP